MFDRSRPSRWIVHPALDLLLICGGAVWILLALIYLLRGGVFMYFLGGQVAFAMGAALYLFSNSHTACSWMRLGHTPRNRESFRFYATGLPALCVAGVILGVTYPVIVPHAIKIYLIWVLQHYSAQVYGLLMIYTLKNSYYMGPWQKNLLKYSCLLFALANMAQYLSTSYAPFVFIVPVPSWGLIPAGIFKTLNFAFYISLVGFLGIATKRYIVEAAVPPLPFFLLLTTFILLFRLPGESGTLVRMLMPTFFHGSQYVLVSAALHMRESGLPVWGRKTLWSAGRYMGAITFLGAVLYVWLPGWCTHAGIPLGIAEASTFAAANFHHFLSDRAIWRLRDPETRALVI